MAAQDKVTFKQDLTEPVKIRHYEGVVFTGDDCGNIIKVALFDGGVPYSGGGTVSATAVLADGTTFPLTQGSITGNMVSVPLEAGALVVSGPMGLYVKISGNGIICTVLNAIFTVQVTDTGRVPAATVTTVNELVQEIKDAQDSFPADLTNLLAAVAPTFSTSTAYSAGAYVWQGGKLYRFTAAHPAGTWTGTDAVTVALGDDVADLKSAVKEYTGNLISDGYTEVSGYYIDKTNNTLVANDSLSCIVFPIRPSTTYYIKKDTATITRAGTAINNNIVANKPFNSVVRHNTASDEHMMITSGSNDHYMFIQLYGTNDPADLRNNAANVVSLIVCPVADNLWNCFDDLASNFANLYIVGANEKYKTIQSACDAASSGDTVLILPGIYEEQVSIWGKKLNIIGAHRDSCILIDNSGNYDTPPLEMNIGSLANLTIHETGSNTDSSLADGKYNTAYCVHIDNSTNTNGETIKIRNCTFINDAHACVGIGLYANYGVEFVDCKFKQTDEKSRSGYERAAVYFHTNSNTGIEGQKISFENCDITTTETYTLWAGRPGGSSGTAECLMVNNRMWSNINGNSSAGVYSDFNSWFVLSASSTGNSIETLNIKVPLDVPNRIAKSANLLGSNYTVLENLYIHGTESKIYYNATAGQRMISVQIEANRTYAIVKNIPSVMRVGTGFLQTPYNNYALSAKAVQSSASTEPVIVTSKDGDCYLYIQMYVDADTVKDITKYIPNCYIYEIGVDLNEIRDYVPYAWGSVNQVARLGWADATPEQSIASYKSAYRHGCRVMLCDVRIARGGTYVCFHEEKLTRIARKPDGSALTEEEAQQKIEDLTIAELNEYDYGIYKGSAYAGTKMLELNDFLAWCSATNCWAFLEIKVALQQSDIVAISNLVKANHLSKRVLILNFYTLDSNANAAIWYANLPKAKIVVGSAYIDFSRSWPIAQAYKSEGYENVYLGFSDTSALTSEIISTVQSNDVGLWYSEIKSESEMEAFWAEYGKYYQAISSSYINIYKWLAENYIA